MPSIFRENLADSFFRDFDENFFGRKNEAPANTGHLMRTDVKETETGFEMDVDLPGIKKEDIQLELEDGVMTISATRNTSSEEKDESGKLIRQERYSGSMKRSFFIGENVTEQDVKAKFEDGVLKLYVPKIEAKLPEKKTIMIEG